LYAKLNAVYKTYCRMLLLVQQFYIAPLQGLTTSSPIPSQSE